VEAAAEIFGTSSAAVSTVLQGFYQAHQATAASVAVNNMHLLRGMLGRPGAGILQMNGQPTAQNNRETGADGDLPGFRNWQNEQHVAALAQTPTARSRKVTQRKQTFAESASSLRASVIITGSNCGHSPTGMGRIRPVSPNGCTPTGCPPRAAAGSDCYAISMICICWPATCTWRGWWSDRLPRGLVIKS
jgi:anaerobic selenocysteine-containing dehydrogenase